MVSGKAKFHDAEKVSLAYGVQVERPLIVMHTWGSGAPPG